MVNGVYTFVCNCPKDDEPKIKRLRYDILFGAAQATPGFSASENMSKGLIGVYQRVEE